MRDRTASAKLVVAYKEWSLENVELSSGVAEWGRASGGRWRVLIGESGTTWDESTALRSVEMVASGGRGFIRRPSAVTDVNRKMEVPIVLDSIGLMDQSLIHLFGPAWLPESIAIPGTTIAVREAVGESGFCWKLSMPEGVRVKEWQIAGESLPDGGWRIESVKVLDRMAHESWEQGLWGTSEWRVVDWSGYEPKRIQVSVLTQDASIALKAGNRRELVVLSRPRDLSGVEEEIGRRLQLQPDEQVLDSRLDLMFRKGSRVFSIGKEKFLAPAPIEEVPEDISSLIQGSRKVPEPGAGR